MTCYFSSRTSGTLARKRFSSLFYIFNIVTQKTTAKAVVFAYEAVCTVLRPVSFVGLPDSSNGSTV